MISNFMSTDDWLIPYNVFQLKPSWFLLLVYYYYVVIFKMTLSIKSSSQLRLARPRGFFEKGTSRIPDLL